MRIRTRPKAEIDWSLKWEMDEKARALVAAYGAFERETLSSLMGVSAEAIRQVEQRAIQKLATAFESIGINGDQ